MSSKESKMRKFKKSEVVRSVVSGEFFVVVDDVVSGVGCELNNLSEVELEVYGRGGDYKKVVELGELEWLVVKGDVVRLDRDCGLGVDGEVELVVVERWVEEWDGESKVRDRKRVELGLCGGVRG